MNFKSPDRMKTEFFDLHPLLQQIICDINHWGFIHNELPEFTCFYRSQAEQDNLINAGVTTYKVSVHTYFRGADLRPFRNETLNLLIEDYINGKYPYGDGHKTIIRHEGTADHLHVQVKYTGQAW